jgi:hypothetical protein
MCQEWATAPRPGLNTIYEHLANSTVATNYKANHDIPNGLEVQVYFTTAQNLICLFLGNRVRGLRVNCKWLQETQQEIGWYEFVL